ncbi:PP2C family protein-serine/threonine phosphatase [Streptomyces sp. NPDC048387]|uniref:PP2C family protein-serine/threonine phosphatase n=1 Tax=Streptomyces sp. NPDC048387 TaxID=3365542 RepID=UPI00371F1EDD
MSPAVPGDTEALEQFITREVAFLRAAAGRSAGVPTPPAAQTGPAEADALTACPCGGSPDHSHSCADGAVDHDPWSCLCAVLPAIPLSAALLVPVEGEDGRIQDFVIRAGNHVRSAEWLDPPDTQAGKRLCEVRPGVEGSGLLDALHEVLHTGHALRDFPVDYTERRPDGLHRTKLLHDAASCSGQVLTTWRPAPDPAELMSLEAQYIASMGWARFDLLSGESTWSEGLSAIFRLRPGRPLGLLGLSDAVVPEDVPRWGRLLRALFDGEEPAGTEIRFSVNGDVRTLHVILRPVIATDGLPWALHLIARDLTQVIRGRQRLAATRRQTERLRDEAAAEHRVASALREALLPTHSSEIAGLGYAVAAAYLPVEEEAAVGGDWYKCRALPDGRILLAIGDACGHGLSAVARMAQQRHALAGLAHTPGSDAGQLTTWLNELVCADASAETATCVIGHLDGDRRLTWACAGHPAPLLLRGGVATALGTRHRGPLLGLIPGEPYATDQAALHRGDLLLLYTDGLVERRGEDLGDSIEALRARLADCAGCDARQALDEVVAGYADDRREDDTCLVVVEVL